MPSGTEIIAFFDHYYSLYGYPLVFLFSVLETIFGLSWQVPGTFVVLLATFYARQGTLFLPYVLILAIVGWFIGDNINYFLGKYGWYRFFSLVGDGKRFEKRGEIYEEARPIGPFSWPCYSGFRHFCFYRRRNFENSL